MKLLVSSFIVFMAACGGPAQRNADTSLARLAPSWDSLVGIIHPPAPAAFVDSGGMTLDSPDTSRWGMGMLVRGQDRYLALDSMHHHDGRKAYWKIIDATALPALTSSQDLVWLDCALDKTPDASIVAVGVWNDTTLTQISYAARPRIAQRRFELLPVDRVSCDVERDRS